MEGAPSCAEGINTFSGPGGFCQCDAVTQINNTPFGCEEIPTTPRPFAEFFADQAVATPFAAGVEFLNGQNRVTQDFCRGMCLGADNCNGYMYGKYAMITV